MVGEYGISSSDYWDMTPAEVGRILEYKRPKYVGGIHEDVLYKLHQRRAELIAEGKNIA